MVPSILPASPTPRYAPDASNTAALLSAFLTLAYATFVRLTQLGAAEPTRT
jgi:hypothetical protein